MHQCVGRRIEPGNLITWQVLRQIEDLGAGRILLQLLDRRLGRLLAIVRVDSRVLDDESHILLHAEFFTEGLQQQVDALAVKCATHKQKAEARLRVDGLMGGEPRMETIRIHTRRHDGHTGRIDPPIHITVTYVPGIGPDLIDLPRRDSLDPSPRHTAVFPGLHHHVSTPCRTVEIGRPAMPNRHIRIGQRLSHSCRQFLEPWIFLSAELVVLVWQQTHLTPLSEQRQDQFTIHVGEARIQEE